MILPFAFSVQHFISSVGADAGFAAIIGLAVLVLLYFAQARETATLREQAAASADQVHELELRVAQLARGGVSAPAPGSVTGTLPPVAPAPPGAVRPAVAAARISSGAPVSAQAATPARAMAGAIPAAPAGVGAPALSAATRLIPASDLDAIAIRANGAIDSDRGDGSGGAAVLAPPGPPPATAAGGANGGAPRAPVPAAAPATGIAREATAGSATRGARPSSPAPQRPDPPRRGGSAPGRPGGDGSGGGRALLFGLLGLLALAAVVVALLVLTSGGGTAGTTSSTASGSTTSTSKTRHRAAQGGATVKPASVTVAVLNGTSIANLAHSTAAQLGGAGFKANPAGNASDQTLTATVVGYLPGHRRAAQLVAQALKLGSASVQPVGQSNQTLACPAASTPCPAQVVVTVGSDLANNT